MAPTGRQGGGSCTGCPPPPPPVCLSLDNLVAGAAVGGAGLPVVLAAGLSACVSGLMALAGLWAGEAVGKRVPVRPQLAGGVALITAAVALVLA
jgi:putative Mn2+ efflux pump MntP